MSAAYDFKGSLWVMGSRWKTSSTQLRSLCISGVNKVLSSAGSGQTYVLKRGAHERRRTLKDFHQDRYEFLEEIRVSGSSTQHLDVVPQFRCQVELLLEICGIVRDCPSACHALRLEDIEHGKVGLPRLPSPSLAAKASMFFSTMVY